MTDLHVHTNFSDGKNTPRQMVEAALEKGMDTLGFSDHSYTSFDLSCCIPKEKLSEYRSCIEDLKREYGDRIRILLGIEQDFYSDFPAEGYDYVIGSVHYVKAGDHYFAVDIGPDDLRRNCDVHFGGDVYAMIEAYFAGYERLANMKFDVVGHIDLISKFNRDGAFFNEGDERYLAAARRAVDLLIPTGAYFEINTGAISRGYRDAPYPAQPILDHIRSKGGKFILSGDTHRAENLCYEFDKWGHLI